MSSSDEQPRHRTEPSPLSEAFNTWSQYSEAAEDLVHLTHEGLSRALGMPDILRTLESEPDQIRMAEWKADRARREVDAGFPNLHAHTLLGLCGALECLVEDIVFAMIQHDPSFLRNGVFDRVKLPASLAVGGDASATFRAIVSGASRATGSDISVGATKYERLLALVGLDGPTPGAVKRALFRAQQIRNVWAHRGGIADHKFVENCSDLGFAVGDRVNMDPELFMPLMHGMHMYGTVLMNRDLKSRGYSKLMISFECQGYEGCLEEIKTPEST